MQYDLAIVGGGPAGLSAAIHGRARDKSVLIVTNRPDASPLCRAERVDNYPGLPHVSGRELVEAMAAQAKALGAVIQIGRALQIMPAGGGFYLAVGSDVAQAKKVILATGAARPSKLPGESELLGRGVSYCATCDGMLYRGKAVVVAGDAPDLEEETAFLRKIGCSVTEAPLEGLKLLGTDKVEGVESKGEFIPCEGVFLLRRSMALSDLLPTLHTENGYIQVDRQMRTNLPGIYAAGDCTGLPLQIAKAAGEGQMAAHTAASELDG